LANLILAFLLGLLLVIQYGKLPLKYCNPLFSRICRGRKMRKRKGTQKFRVLW